MIRAKCRGWIAVLCIALVALAAASPAFGLPFEGILVPLGMLFALVIVAVVLPPRDPRRPIDEFAGVISSRAPPIHSHLF